MGVETPLNKSDTGNRKAKRARVLLSARLETPFGDIECRLRDLSRKGALIECRPTPPMGTELLFVRGPITVPARVAWSQPGRLGLEFKYMIDEAEMLVQLKPSSASLPSPPPQSYRRPGIKEGLSEAERKLAAAWGMQVGINIPDEGF